MDLLCCDYTVRNRTLPRSTATRPFMWPRPPAPTHATDPKSARCAWRRRLSRGLSLAAVLFLLVVLAVVERERLGDLCDDGSRHKLQLAAMEGVWRWARGKAASGAEERAGSAEGCGSRSNELDRVVWGGISMSFFPIWWNFSSN
jgi:hypothetical protein